MKGRIAGTLFCLAFAIPFGGVGLWATWTFATTLRDAWGARDWVLVRADVIASDLVVSSGRSRSVRAAATYRYTFEGKEYTSSRLSIVTMGGADNIGDWQEEMAAFLEAARKEKRPVEVYVNPAQPSQAVVDRKVRWPLMLFLTPFMVLFGGVGVVAFVGAWHIATKPAGGSPRAPQKAFARGGAIPPEAVAIEARGNKITLNYPGGIFASLFGRLTVTAGDGQLLVEKAGLFGRKEYRAASSAVTAITPALSYTVTSGSQERRYYSLSATTRDGERIPLGRGIQGGEVATAVGLRIATALKLPPDRVSRAPSTL